MTEHGCPASSGYIAASSPTCSSQKQNMANISNTGGNVGHRAQKFLEIVHTVRDPLAEYQEKQGLPKNEQYTFVNLITALWKQGCQGILTILTMLYSLVPLLDGFLYLSRFVLDKLLEIGQTESKSQMALRIGLFTAELLVIGIMSVIICGLIIYPVWQLFSSLLSKVWHILHG